MKRLTRLLVVILAGLLIMSGGPFIVRSAGLPQAVELSDSEPNDSCATAQDLGLFSEPIRLTGSFDGVAMPYPTPEPPPDADPLDFFRLSTTPAMQLLIALRGAPSGQGTLPDPLLGIFDSNCNLLASVDDSAMSLEPEFFFTTPEDGVLIIAATAFADFTFVGNGSSGGSYLLSIQEAQFIQGISGSLVDSTTNEAPLGTVQLQLQRCVEATTCTTVQSITSSDGSFSFSSNSYQPLLAGSYQILVQSEFYQPLTIEPFTVARDELKILDPVVLQRLPEIGSISGQLVNALNNQPIRGNVYVTLLRCQDGSCWEYVDTLTVNSEGRFSRPLMEGEYQITAYADQFEGRSFDPFTVTAGEQRELEPLALQPNPIQFFNPQGCPEIPAQGGDCHYSIEIVSGQPEAVQLKVWSVIFVQSPNYGAFQPDAARTLRLRPGQGRVARFSLAVPANVPDYTSFCGGVYVADAVQGFYFQPKLSSFIFCSTKGADGVFRMLPEQAARELSQRIQSEPAAPPAQPQKLPQP